MSDQPPAPQGTPGTTTTTPATTTPAATTTPPAGQPAATTKPLLAGKYETRDALLAGTLEIEKSVSKDVLTAMPDAALEAFYRNAQRAFTRERQEASKGNDNPFAALTQPAKATVNADDDPRQIFEKAGINFDAAMSSGGLSEADKKALSATYGWDNTAISLATAAGKAHFQGEKSAKDAAVQTRNSQIETQVYPIFGGKEKMDELLAKSQSVLSQEDRGYYAKAFQNPDVAHVRAAAEAFKTIMAVKLGQPIGTAVTATPMGNAPNKPATTAEMRDALAKHAKGLMSLDELNKVLAAVPAKKG